MSQIATTVEQSKRLIDAGLDPNSADMSWYKAINGKMFLTVRGEIPFWDCDAWSLSALWDHLRRSGKTYEFDTLMSSEEMFEAIVDTIVKSL